MIAHLHMYRDFSSYIYFVLQAFAPSCLQAAVYSLLSSNRCVAAGIRVPGELKIPPSSLVGFGKWTFLASVQVIRSRNERAATNGLGRNSRSDLIVWVPWRTRQAASRLPALLLVLTTTRPFPYLHAFHVGCRWHVFNMYTQEICSAHPSQPESC